MAKQKPHKSKTDKLADEIMDVLPLEEQPYTAEHLDKISQLEDMDPFHLQIIVEAARQYLSDIPNEVRDSFTKMSDDSKKAFRSINKNVRKTQEDLDTIVEDYSYIQFLSNGQVQALDYLRQATKLLSIKPLPISKNKSGAVGYTKLKDFVNQVRAVYISLYPQKRAKPSQRNTAEHGYDGHYFNFMCTCIMAINKTHDCYQQFGNYLSKPSK